MLVLASMAFVIVILDLQEKLVKEVCIYSCLEGHFLFIYVCAVYIYVSYVSCEFQITTNVVFL